MINILNFMRYLIIILILFCGCQNPSSGNKETETDKPIHEYKLRFESYNYSVDCDSIEYDYANDVLIIHTTPCGETIPEFSKFIFSNNFKIIPK
jgi:hypothetical protein